MTFSGEELGLIGSKMVRQPNNAFRKINYMLNMDMIGRLNDSSKNCFFMVLALLLPGMMQLPKRIHTFQLNQIVQESDLAIKLHFI